MSMRRVPLPLCLLPASSSAPHSLSSSIHDKYLHLVRVKPLELELELFQRQIVALPPIFHRRCAKSSKTVQEATNRFRPIPSLTTYKPPSCSAAGRSQVMSRYSCLQHRPNHSPMGPTIDTCSTFARTSCPPPHTQDDMAQGMPCRLFLTSEPKTTCCWHTVFIGFGAPRSPSHRHTSKLPGVSLLGPSTRRHQRSTCTAGRRLSSAIWI